MTRVAAALAVLLSFAILTVWVGQRWAWGLSQFAVFVCIGFWAAGQWRHPSPVRWNWWLAPLSAAPLWGLLQLAAHRSVYRWGTWNAVLNWATWLALFFLALQLFQRSAAGDWFLRFALYFGAALSVLATVQMFTSDGKIFWLFPSGYTVNVLGPFVNRNEYAAFLEMILPIALWQAVRDRRLAFANCAIAAAMLASVVASSSRAGSILVCMEVAAVLLLAWRQGLAPARILARALATFAVIAVFFVAIAGWQALRQRLREPDPLAGRRELVASSLAMLHDRPAMGFGLGNWARAYPQYALFDDGTYVNQAHNDWLQWAVEGGVPFFLMLLSLAAMAAPAAVHSIWGIGLLSLWVHCLVDYPLQQRPAIGAWFFVLLGVLASSRGWAGDRADPDPPNFPHPRYDRERRLRTRIPR
ncbi:MAG TPA: O-antigen ligase family protein [Bryobacteraceae bacterium]|jgi:O-antigen ligase|nr:O-antigen ligase family protein [Bryobacteraceae bacterium]